MQLQVHGVVEESQAGMMYGLDMSVPFTCLILNLAWVSVSL